MAALRAVLGPWRESELWCGTSSAEVLYDEWEERWVSVYGGVGVIVSFCSGCGVKCVR